RDGQRRLAVHQMGVLVEGREDGDGTVRADDLTSQSSEGGEGGGHPNLGARGKWSHEEGGKEKDERSHGPPSEGVGSVGADHELVLEKGLPDSPSFSGKEIVVGLETEALKFRGVEGKGGAEPPLAKGPEKFPRLGVGVVVLVRVDRLGEEEDFLLSEVRIAEGSSRRQSQDVSADRRLPSSVEAPDEPDVGPALEETAPGNLGPAGHPLRLQRGMGARGGVAEAKGEVRAPDLGAVGTRS